MFLHIPRTGGTTLEHAVGHYLDRTNDRYLKHYHYVQNFSDYEYNNNLIPLLINRTSAQQKELKILTGHSIFCNSHKWLKANRTPKIFTYTRHPIYRLLSSFNHRHKIATVSQDPQAFSTSTPALNNNAVYQKKIASDYETLYEYYLDSNFEQNIQCKWIVKSFLTRENNTWYRHPEYMFGPDAGIPVEEAVPLSWPGWMFEKSGEEIDWFKLAENFFPEIWWMSRLEMIDEHLEDLCQYIGVEYVKVGHQNKTGDHLCDKYWTIEDVMKQHDIEKLIEAEKYDFQLYEVAKEWKRPF